MQHTIGTRETRNPYSSAIEDMVIEADSHVYVLGQTGTGKSTFAEHLFVEKAQKGGCAFFDPHGSTAERIAGHIPRFRTKDTVYLDAGNSARPFSYGPLWRVPEARRSLIAEGLVYALRSIFPDSWGPVLQMILTHSVQSVMDLEEATLFDVLRFMGDKTFRKAVIGKTTNKAARFFWEVTFPEWDPRYRQNAFPSAYNKLDQLLNSPEMLNILAQGEPSFSLEQIMRNEQILICNLNQGTIGPLSSNLFGSLLLSEIYTIAMQQPPDDRKRFTVFVDEFPNFATNSFSDILSQARKYELFLILMTQFESKIPQDVRDAIRGNVNTHVLFRCGYEDAVACTQGFTLDDYITASTLATLGDGMAVIKMFQRGLDGCRTYEHPFIASMRAPLRGQGERAEKLIRDAQKRFNKKPLAEVDEIVDERMRRKI